MNKSSTQTKRKEKEDMERDIESDVMMSDLK
jgi:hypothetical protein